MTEGEQAVQEEVVVEKQISKRKLKANLNAERYQHYVRVQDQLSQLKELQNASKNREEVLNINVEQLKANLKEELELEKQKYIKSLEAQEELLKTDTSRRVFSIVEELEGVQAEEKKFIDDRVKEKRSSFKKPDSKKQINDKETKRKEILTKYSQMKGHFNQEGQLSLAQRFDLLPEDQQRNLFKLLKINYARELAIAELTKYDTSADLGQIEMHHENAQEIQEMLKQILPKYFKEEYLSLKHIQDKKANVQKIFENAEAQQLNKLDQIQEIQAQLRKIEKDVSPEAVRNQIADLLLNKDSAQKVQNFEGFEANRKVIENIQAALTKLPAEEVTDQQRQIELKNQQSRSSYKYNLKQTENLLKLVNNSNDEFYNEINANMKEITYRQKSIEDPSVKTDTVFDLEQQEEREMDRIELPQLLSKYNVDPEWVRNKKTEQLAKLMEDFQVEMRVRSQILAQDFVEKDSTAINALFKQSIYKQTASQEQLQSRLRIFAHANGIEDDKMLKQTMTYIHQILNENKEIPEIPSEYQTSEALFSRVRPPTKSVIDVHSNEQRSGFSTEKMTDILTYNEYRINQIKKARKAAMTSSPAHIVSEDQPLLIEQMTAAKRNAWLNIYNDFQDFKRRQEAAKAVSEFDTPAQLPGDSKFAMVSTKQDFFELFRDWEVRNLNIQNPSKEMRKYLQSYGEVSVDKDGNRVVNAGIDMAAIQKELKESSDAVFKQLADQETERVGHFIEGLEKESFEQQVQGQELAQIQSAFNKAVAEVERERGAKSTDPAAFSQEEIEIYLATAQLLEDARKQFKAEYGEDVISDSMINVFDADVLCPVPKDNKNNADAVYTVRKNIKLMDDALVRQIEAHLAGVPRLSDEYGIDAEFVAEQTGRNSQVFDQENYDNFKLAERLENMSPHERQQELLHRRQLEKFNFDKELALREYQMLEQSKVNQEINRNFPLGIELYNKLQENYTLQGRPKEAFDRVIKNIGRDAARHKSLAELLDERMNNEEASFTQIDASLVNIEAAKQNARFVVGKEMTAEDKVLASMASNFETFDYKKVSASALQTSFTTGHPISLKELYQSAQSSSQLEQVAATQTLSPEDQQIENIVQTDNKVSEAYLQAKYQMFINEQTKTQLAVKILNAREMLSTVQAKYNQLLRSAGDFTAQFTGDVPNSKHFDFMQFEVSLRDPVSKAKAIANRLEKFNPNDTNVENYNEELRLQLNLLEASNAEKKNMSQVGYVVQQMRKNGVQPDSDTFALLFGIALEAKNIEEANIYLKKMQAGFGTSPIAKSRLERFFNESVARDNFDGLAYLAAYLESNNVNIEDWNMQRFRSALSFYLNHQFNLNKILTFLRFYTHQAKSVIEGLNVDAAQSEQEALQAFEKVFGNLDSLVDMNALFSHLVEVVGQKTFIDPVTKQDPIINLIEFFSRSDVQNLCKLSKEGTTFISNGDIAKYLSNHFGESRSFQHVAKVVRALDGSPHGNELLVMQLLSSLSEYQARHGQLPMSFSTQNIRNLYLEVKAQNQKVSEKTAEFLLYLFKSNGLHAETIDLCDNFQSLVRGFDSAEAATRSDIRSYYLSECLLNHPGVEGSTYDLIQKAVFAGRKDGASYLSSMVKAHLKDGSTEHALKFFEEQIQKRRILKQNEEKELLELFNSTFGGSGSQLQLDQFKDKYLEVMMVREQTRKELHAIARLEKILNNCDQNELDAVFLLQIVMNEEKQLISSLCTPEKYLAISSQVAASKTQAEVAKILSTLTKDSVDKLAEELMTIRTRKHALEQTIQHQNREHLLELMQVMEDGNVMLFGKAVSFDDALTQLGMTQQDYAQLMSFHQNSTTYADVIKVLKRDRGVASEDDRADSDSIMRSFNLTLKNLVEKRLQQHDRFIEQKRLLEPFGLVHHHRDDFETFTGIRALDLIEDFVDGDLPTSHDHLEALRRYRSYIYDEPYFKLDKMKKGLEEEEPSGDSKKSSEDSQYSVDQMERIYQEPDAVVNLAYNELIGETADVVAQAYEVRKKISLSKMIETFNRVQNIQFKKFGQNLVRNPDTFSRGEIESIKNQTQVKVKPGKNVLETAAKGGIDLSEIQQNNGNLVLDSLVAKELDRRRLESGYSLAEDVDIGTVLNEFDSLLSDGHSPVISNFLHLMNYQNGEDIMPFEEFFEQVKEGKQPINEYQMHAEVLEKQIDRVDQVIAALNDAALKIQEKTQNVQTKEKQLNQFYDEWSQQKTRAEHLVQEQVETLHRRFNDLVAMRQTQVKLEFTGDASLQALSDSDKVQIMHRVLQMETGDYQPFQIFNSFYSEDLIVFGIKNNIPEAVRLGEKMLNENGTALSPEMARAVKLWKLDHSQQYRDAIKTTGAIDYDKVYRTAKKSGSDGYNRDSVINLDDPYWQEFFAKNYRTQDKYKLPSAFTWDHRPSGILGEIFDMKQVSERVQKNTTFI